MKNKKNIIAIVSIVLVIVITVIIAIFVTKKNRSKDMDINVVEPQDAPQEITLDESQQPYISLKAQADGHRLDIKISDIPSIISEIEYDLIYTAQDENLEIEKGVGGTAEVEGNTFERELLLGTESCTNGCKYKYDEGITGGTLILNLITKDNQSAYFEAPFIFTNDVDQLVLEDITINTKGTSSKDYFILIKNYQSTYSLTSSGKGVGTVTSIEPETYTKEDMSTVTGDYILQ